MTTLALLCIVTALPPGEDLPLPTGATTGPSSARLSLPVLIEFDPSISSEAVQLVKDDNSTRAGETLDAVGAIRRFGPSVGRRHFEDASWSGQPRKVVVKRVAVMFRTGPHYEVTVDVDRYEGDRRLGQASGKGYGSGQRNNAQRTGAAYASMFGGKPKNGLTEANPATDGEVIRNATLQAFDSALMQLSAVWSGEQLMQKAREDAEAAVKAANTKKKK